MTLRINDLSLARGGVPVLAGLSFTLAPGRALILRGPNGVGKTTLLRTVAGLQPPLSGAIEGAEDQVAYCGHSDGLKLGLTVTENLRFWAQIFGQRDIEPALQAFALIGLHNRPAGGLSAGQKRRLALARMMVTGRRIWVLDEPTVSLDAASVALFASAVEAHLATGGAALLATHIDLGLQGDVLDLGPFKAKVPVSDGFDEVFL